MDQDRPSRAFIPPRARHARHSSDGCDLDLIDVDLNPKQRVQCSTTPVPVHQHLCDHLVSSLLFGPHQVFNRRSKQKKTENIKVARPENCARKG